MTQQILKLSEAEIILGGQAVKFKMHTTGGDGDLAVSISSLPQFIQFVISLASVTEDDGAAPSEIFPVSVDRVEVQEGSSPDTAVMILKIGAVALPLEMPKVQLADTARRLLLAANAPKAGSKLN